MSLSVVSGESPPRKTFLVSMGGGPELEVVMVGDVSSRGIALLASTCLPSLGEDSVLQVYLHSSSPSLTHAHTPHSLSLAANTLFPRLPLRPTCLHYIIT